MGFPNDACVASYSPPNPTIPLSFLNQQHPVSLRRSVRTAISNLPPLKSGERDGKDPLHFARKHQAIALQRMAHIEINGGDRFSLPVDLELACHRGKKGFPDVYGRMWWDRVAPDFDDRMHRHNTRALYAPDRKSSYLP